MDQITVPQFIDNEDKILGEISVRQFIELVIGGCLVFISYKIFDFSLFIVAGVAIAFITVVFAFAKVNGQHFHLFLLNLIVSFKNPKLKVWKREKNLSSITRNELSLVKNLSGRSKIINPNQASARKSMVSSSRLSELSLIVDTGGVYHGEEDDKAKDLNK